MSAIKIGPYTFRIIKQNGRKVLLAWTEASGVEKTRWLTLTPAMLSDISLRL